MGLRVWDAHCHLDFMSNAAEVASEARELGLGIFANTVTPAGFEALSERLPKADNVCMGAGLHPWWVADQRCSWDEVELACQLARQHRFIGEVGIDLSPRHVPEGSMGLQAKAFEALCRACAETSSEGQRKLLSIHSVRAASLVLDVLEDTGCLGGCTCIFHWFTGASDELHRAVRGGCYFSINEMMLATRRGREYARQLPADRLLVETDFPPGEDVVFSAEQILASLEGTLERIGEIRGADVGPQIAETSARLFG